MNIFGYDKLWGPSQRVVTLFHLVWLNGYNPLKYNCRLDNTDYNPKMRHHGLDDTETCGRGLVAKWRMTQSTFGRRRPKYSHNFLNLSKIPSIRLFVTSLIKGRFQKVLNPIFFIFFNRVILAEEKNFLKVK